MSWSLAHSSPSFIPGFPRWADLERDMDRDLSRLHRMFSDVAQTVHPDQHGIHHRQPSYTYQEDNQQAHIEVELPGVAKENVNISLQGDKLQVSAKRFKPATIASVTHIPVETGEQEQMQEQMQEQTQEQMQEHMQEQIQEQMQNEGKAHKKTNEAVEEVMKDEQVKPAEAGETAQAEPAPSVVYELNIPIGNKFDVDKIAANMLGDGILSLVVPKKVEHTGVSRVIQIGSA